MPPTAPDRPAAAPPVTPARPVARLAARPRRRVPALVRALGAVLSAVLVAVSAAGCSGATAADADGLREWAPGERPAAPALTGTTLDGRPWDSATTRGKVLVLNFWASWCPPCQDEAATLEQVATDTATSGVEFLGVDVRDDREQARAFLRAHAVSYPSLFDPSSETLLAFRKPTLPTAPPTTLVVDRAGRVAAMIVGAADFTVLEPLVLRVAAEQS